MRISGGKARGIPLQVPKSAKFRPAIDRLRQGVFSSLGDLVPGSVFADFFAGTGSYGLEALSRGADGGIFVEQDRANVACLRRNVEAVCKSLGGGAERVSVSHADVLSWQPPAGFRAGLIFVDPPFRLIESVAPAVFARIESFAADEPATTVVFEMPGELTISRPGWELWRRIGKGRGQPTCCLYRRSATSS